MLNNEDVNVSMPELDEPIFQKEGQVKKPKFKFSPIYLGYLIGGLILFFGAYTMIHKLFPTADKEVTQVKNEGFNFSVAGNQTSKPITLPSAQVSQANNSDANIMSPALSGELDDISIKIENILQNQKTIVMNQSGSKDLDVSSRKSIESQIYAIDQKIDALTKAMQTYENIQSNFKSLQQSLAQLLADQTSKKTPLSVIAMLDGKAWVKTQDDKTIFLTLGSEIKGYGDVVKIDPDAGKIFMSSGFVIN